MVDLMIELQEEQSQAIAGLPYLSLQLSPEVKVAVQLKFVRETLVLTTNRFTQMPNVHKSTSFFYSFFVLLFFYFFFFFAFYLFRMGVKLHKLKYASV